MIPHPEFEHLNPDEIDIAEKIVDLEKNFRPIELDNIEELC